MLVDFIVVGLIWGFLRGGKLRNLSQVDFPFLWVIILGFGIEFLALAGLQPFVVFNLAGRGLALLGALLNMHLYGMKSMSLGASLNFLVIALNGGKMPVSLEVTSWLGLQKYVELLENNYYPDYTIISSSTLLPFLGDVLPYFSFLFRRFFVASLGDYFLGIGVMLFLVYHLRKEEVKA